MKDFSNIFKNEFIMAITPSTQKRDCIRSAVAIIKEKLKSDLKDIHGIGPRFMTQGSAGYKTQNSPCYDTQQIDYDIGCYFPFSEWEEQKPKKAANEFFSEVDTILEGLCKAEGWSLDKSKNTCCRIIIAEDIHIDIPLYSIPDNEFKTITESVESRKSFSAMDSNEPQEESWDDFNFDKVLLAHREEGWIESDPRKVNLYFKNVFDQRDEQLRRLCRYLKAWRDFKWKEGGPSSIFLMFLVVDLYEKNNGTSDDKALYVLLTQIPNRLNKPVFNKVEEENLTHRTDTEEDERRVFNKVEEGENLTERNMKYIKLLQEFAGSFAEDMGRAIYDKTIDDVSACKLIQKHLGNRFPCGSVPKKENEIVDEIRKEPISKVNSTPLLRTRAG